MKIPPAQKMTAIDCDLKRITSYPPSLGADPRGEVAGCRPAPLQASRNRRRRGLWSPGQLLTGCAALRGPLLTASAAVLLSACWPPVEAIGKHHNR
jgi:hypothetical protein